MTIESFPIQTRVFDPDSKLDDSPAAVKLRYEQNADTNGFTDAEKAKLDGVAAGATANAPDAELRDRATHTGAQAIGTVTGLQAALDGKAAAAHAHTVGDVAGLQAELDGKAASAHTHPLSALMQSGAAVGQVPIWGGAAWTPGAAGGGGLELIQQVVISVPVVQIVMTNLGNFREVHLNGWWIASSEEAEILLSANNGFSFFSTSGHYDSRGTQSNGNVRTSATGFLLGGANGGAAARDAHASVMGFNQPGMKAYTAQLAASNNLVAFGRSSNVALQVPMTAISLRSIGGNFTSGEITFWGVR